MQFKKNELINKTIDEFTSTWSHMLDTGDYVDTKYAKKIDKYIFKNLKQKFKEIEVYNLLYLQENNYKLGLFQKLKIHLSGLKPIYEKEKKEQQEKQRLKEAKKHKKKKKVK